MKFEIMINIRFKIFISITGLSFEVIEIVLMRYIEILEYVVMDIKLNHDTDIFS